VLSSLWEQLLEGGLQKAPPESIFDKKIGSFLLWSRTRPSRCSMGVVSGMFWKVLESLEGSGRFRRFWKV